MRENFRATNDFIDELNDHMSDARFSEITLQPEKSIKENCDVIINRMQEIQDLLDDKDRRLAECLEPDLYRKLIDLDIRVGMKYLHDKTEAAKITYILGTAIGGLVLLCMRNIVVFINAMTGLYGLRLWDMPLLLFLSCAWALT